MKVNTNFWRSFFKERRDVDPDKITSEDLERLLNDVHEIDFDEKDLPVMINIIVIWYGESAFQELFQFLEKFYNYLYIDDILYWYYMSITSGDSINIITRYLGSIKYQVNMSTSKVTVNIDPGGRNKLFISLLDRCLDIKFTKQKSILDALRSPFQTSIKGVYYHYSISKTSILYAETCYIYNLFHVGTNTIMTSRFIPFTVHSDIDEINVDITHLYSSPILSDTLLNIDNLNIDNLYYPIELYNYIYLSEIKRITGIDQLFDIQHGTPMGLYIIEINHKYTFLYRSYNKTEDIDTYELNGKSFF